MRIALPARGSRSAQGDRNVAATRWAWPHWRLVPRGHVIATAVVVTIYLVLVATGATTSSIAVSQLTVEGSSSAGGHWGDLQPIRSDEYNSGTPIRLSRIATGGEPTLSPLGAEASLVHRYPVGPIQQIVFFDSLPFKLGPILPDAQLFAAHWWLPTLLLLLCMPTWFVLMGGRRLLGWLAGILIAFSPDNFWWSLQPTQQLAYTLAGCTAMLAAARRFSRGERLIPLLQCALGGICIAGMPSNYLLWSMLLGGGVLLASTVRLLARASRATLSALVVTGVIAAVLGLGVIWEGREGLEALASTVYPGSRRESAHAVDTGMLFGAPLLGSLSHTTIVGTNASELSSALNLTLLLTPLAWLAWPGRVFRPIRAGELALAAWGWLWLAWCMVTVGDLGLRIPLMSSVPPERAAQSIGIIGIIALCLALSHIRTGNHRLALVAGAGAALLTLQAGAILRQGALPDLDLVQLWTAGIGVGVCTSLLLLRPYQWLGVTLASALGFASVATASPLQFGLADLRGNPSADEMASAGAQARADGTLWASDFLPLNTLMVANGVPALSGFQPSGPDVAQWERIDPDRRYESSWNRAGAYSNFAWNEDSATEIVDNGFDSIYTRIDPCTLAEDVPELGHIASTVPLNHSPCLTLTGQLRFSGHTIEIYEVNGR